MDLSQYFQEEEAVLTLRQSTATFLPRSDMELSQPEFAADSQLESMPEEQAEEFNSSTLEEADDVDTSSRPRLTQEQANILEEKFAQQPKPVTEVKRQLALEIGLPLQRVNVSRLVEGL